jgi:recombination protein RecA
MQKNGGVGVLIDTESAVNQEFFSAVGVDWSKLVYVNTEAIEDVFEMIETIIGKVRETDRDRPVVIIVDSIAGASTRSELEGTYAKEGYATDKSIIISRAMRKMTNLLAKQRILVVFTNQLRMKMNAPAFADPYTTSGGKAVGFHASVRARLSVIKKIKQSDKIIGTTVRAKIVKNRVGPPHREAEFDIYFDRGIDDYASWLKTMKENKLIKGAGAWYTFTDSSGEETKFQSKDFAEFLEADPDRKERIYQQICEKVIMSYRRNDVEPLDFAESTEE